MALQVSNIEAVGVLANLRDQIMVEQATFARKRSVSQGEKECRNADVQRQKAAIDKAVTALMAAIGREV